MYIKTKDDILLIKEKVASVVSKSNNVCYLIADITDSNQSELIIKKHSNHYELSYTRPILPKLSVRNNFDFKFIFNFTEDGIEGKIRVKEYVVIMLSVVIGFIFYTFLDNTRTYPSVLFYSCIILLSILYFIRRYYRFKKEVVRLFYDGT